MALNTRITVENGKDFNIKADPHRSGYVISFEGGGELPPSLKGHWTSVHTAKAAVDSYISIRGEPDARNRKRKRVPNVQQGRDK